jgi:phospholipase C
MPGTENQLNRINHIVTLMLENRSFDNVLGWLYVPDNDPPFDKVPRGQTFEGVSGKDLSNPRPGGGVARVGKNTVMTDPYTDINEPKYTVYEQI